MEREVVKNNNNHQHHRGEVAFGTAYETTITTETTTTPATDFVLQWGNRKRLRCMKIQVKDDSTADAKTTTVRVDRRVVKAEKEFSSSNTITTTTNNNNNFNLRRPTSSPPPPPPPPPTHRILRNSETSGLMKGQTNGVRSSTSFSPERGGEERAHDKKSNNTTTNNNNHHHHHNNNNNGGGGPSMSSETAQDSKKGGSSSGSEVIPVWPPKFVIALTNKEKEEDFMAIKGSKLPLRPKKRAKIIQRTLNLVSPGSWLCDLTIERYEVREKKITKKRPRGLKAMGNIDSDSE